MTVPQTLEAIARAARQTEVAEKRPMSEIEGKDLVVAVQSKVNQAARTAYATVGETWEAMPWATGLAVKYKTTKGADTGKKGPQYELVRVAASDCKVPFFGRVIERTVANILKNDELLPVRCTKGGGPTLYLEGSHTLNVKSTNYCAAWLAKGLFLVASELKEIHVKSFTISVTSCWRKYASDQELVSVISP